MGLEINSLYRFDGFEMDAANRSLTRGGDSISIPARAFDLLLFMARNPGRLLTKEELMRAVWGAAAVEESNLTQSVFLLRKALSANQPGENKPIVTVPGRGYRFACEVECVIPPQPPPAEIAPPRDLPSRRRLLPVAAATIMAAAVVATALIVIPRLLRRPAKPLPLPHPITSNAAEVPVASDSISSDGRYLAYADPRFVTIRTLASGETRSIPLGDGVTPVRVDWYPDATRLLVSVRENELPKILVFSVLTGKLTLLRDDSVSPSTSPDGKTILYANGTNRELWLMDGNGENPRRILTAIAPDKLYPMFWSPDDLRVWFVRVHWDKDRETVTLETCNRTGGARTVVLSDNHITAFRLLAQGRLLYALLEGTGNFTNLWELPVDAAAGVADGPPRKLSDWPNFHVSAISATADGKHLALLNGGFQSDVFVGDLQSGGSVLANARPLTLDLSDDSPAFWTADDRAVVFDSTRNGRAQLFRQRLDQTVPELLSTDSEEDQFPRFGGPWIYFHSLPLGERMAWNKPLSIRRIPARRRSVRRSSDRYRRRYRLRRRPARSLRARPAQRQDPHLLPLRPRPWAGRRNRKHGIRLPPVPQFRPVAGWLRDRGHKPERHRKPDSPHPAERRRLLRGRVAGPQRPRSHQLGRRRQRLVCLECHAVERRVSPACKSQRRIPDPVRAAPRWPRHLGHPLARW